MRFRNTFTLLTEMTALRNLMIIAAHLRHGPLLEHFWVNKPECIIHTVALAAHLESRSV